MVPVIDEFAAPVGPAPSSGNWLRTSHASASRRPVLVPP